MPSSEIKEMEMITLPDDSDRASQDDAELLWKNVAQPLTVTMKIFGLYHGEDIRKSPFWITFNPQAIDFPGAENV